MLIGLERISSPAHFLVLSFFVLSFGGGFFFWVRAAQGAQGVGVRQRKLASVLMMATIR